MTNPTPAVENIRAAVLREFPRVQDGGIYNRRKIAGSSRWSQHAYANAWDIFGPTRSAGPADQEYLDDVYAFLAANRSALSIGELCWKSKGGCSAAAHQDHVHVSGPKMSGDPDNPSGGGVIDAVRDAVVGLIPGARGVEQLVPGGGGGDNPLVPDSVETAADIGRWISDPDNWKRIGMGAAGVALLVVAVALLAKDLVPGVVGDVAAQAVGASS